MTCCQQRAFFLLRTALKPLNWIWGKLIESKISMSSTKFVFFGPIRKPRCGNKCSTLYSGARYVALWASCFSCNFLIFTKNNFCILCQWHWNNFYPTASNIQPNFASADCVMKYGCPGEIRVLALVYVKSPSLRGRSLKREIHSFEPFLNIQPPFQGGRLIPMEKTKLYGISQWKCIA